MTDWHFDPFLDEDVYRDGYSAWVENKTRHRQKNRRKRHSGKGGAFSWRRIRKLDGWAPGFLVKDVRDGGRNRGLSKILFW